MASIVGTLDMFLLNFFFFLGLKLNYLDKLEIKEFYNVLFVDNQNIIIFIIGATTLGFLLIFLRNSTIKAVLFAITWLLSALTLITPIGYSMGEYMFKKENQSIQMQTQTFKGDIMYESRDHLFVRFNNDDSITKIKKDTYATHN